MHTPRTIAKCLSLLATLALAAFTPLPPPALPPGQLPPVAHPYDETADAHAAVAAAIAQARMSGKRVLLDFGANWCPDCRMLAGVMTRPDVQRWIGRQYVPVLIDVGRFTKNMDLPRRYGVTVTGIPAVLIVTPEGKLLNPDALTELANARTMSTQATVDLLASWGVRS